MSLYTVSRARDGSLCWWERSHRVTLLPGEAARPATPAEAALMDKIVSGDASETDRATLRAMLNPPPPAPVEPPATVAPVAPAIDVVPFQTAGQVKGCLMPSVMPALDAQLYQKLRALHCERAEESHDCSGRVTLDRNGITLQCPLCGDSRQVYPKPEETIS